MRTSRSRIGNCPEAGPRHAERGQVLPLLAFALAALIGMASMGISVGIWRYQQQLAQTAADSAAVAAAVELKNSGTLATIYAAANLDSAANGFTGSSANGVLNATSKVTVAVNNPPASGAQSTNANAVEVIVSKQLPVYFAWTSLTVSARAVATNPTSSNCLVALGTQYNVVTLDSGTKLSMPTCGFASNGWLQLNGGGITINAKSATYRLGITGTGTYPKATPSLATATTTDPCATIPGCNYLKTTPPSSTCSTGGIYTNSPTGSENLTPGTYCFTTFAAGTYNFAAGVYNFKYGFSENGKVNLVGTGVTIYVPNSLTFGSSGTINLTAPTSGNTAGVVLYLAGNSGLEFNANPDPVTLNGLVYVPGNGSSSSGIVLLDGNDVTVGSLVSNYLTANSNSSITFSGSSSSGGNGGLSE